MNSPPALPEGALLQSLVLAADAPPVGFRVFEDGRFERTRDGLQWESISTLPAERIQALRAALEAGGLEQLQPCYRASQAADDAVSMSLQARVGGEVVGVVVEKPCKVEAFDEIYQKIGPLLR